jgi:hypothetical protein
MSRIVSNYTANGSSLTDEYGTLIALYRSNSGGGVYQGMQVVANSSPGMSVYVQTGSGAIPTGTAPSNYGYFIGIDTSGQGELVSIATASTSPRISYIVAYINKAQAASTAVTNNTNNVFMLAEVQGTPAGSPSVPTTTQIQTTIGASNPYVILAQVLVGASVSQITNANITDMRTFITPQNQRALGANSYVDSGAVWSQLSGLNGTMTAGTVYINVAGAMVPVVLSSVASRAFTASKDTYVAVDYTGSITYNEVANNATSPTLPTNAIWLAIVVTSGSAITSVNTGQIGATAPVISNRTLMVSDTNGQLIYPKANQRNIGTAITQSAQTGITTTQTDISQLYVTVKVPAQGADLKIQAQVNFTLSAPPNSASIMIAEGATVLQTSRIDVSNSLGHLVSASIPITASGGVHTYKIAAATDGGTMSTVFFTGFVSYISVDLD